MLALICPAKAQLSKEQIAAAKGATALVTFSGGSATAFCVSESGLFITCNHVVTKAKSNPIQIVVDPTGKNEKRYAAKVIRQIEKSDLAILKVELTKPVPALKLGSDTQLFETQQLTAFGYPFGNALAVDPKSYPSVSINLGRITSLRKKVDVLEAIQLDAQLNHGNSGGPILDEKGTVVGVVASGYAGSGINFAIPVSHLQPAIATPIMAVEKPRIVYAKRFEPAEFAVSADWLQLPAAEPAVSIEISEGGMQRRADAIKGKDGKYRATIAPFQQRSLDEKKKLAVTLEFDFGKIVGTIEDMPVLIAGKSRPLAEIRTIERAGSSANFEVDGQMVGALPELTKLAITLGGTVVTVDGQKVRKMEIAPPSSNNSNEVKYKAEIKAAGGQVLASEEGILSIDGPVTAMTPVPPLKNGVNLSAKREIKLPSPVSDVVAAENGRVLILYLKDSRKLAVFDVAELKIRGYIGLASDSVLFAGGTRHAIVAYPNENLIQRFSLKTLEKERTINNPLGSMVRLVMGSSSQDFALIVSKNQNSTYNAGMFDVNRMAAVGKPAGCYDPSVIRASAEGRTFGVWRPQISPGGFNILSFKDNVLSQFSTHESPGLQLPNADGSIIFTSTGIFTAKYVPILKNSIGRGPYFPSYHPTYFFSAQVIDDRFGRDRGAPKNSSISIYLTGSTDPLVQLPDQFEEVLSSESGIYSGERNYEFTMDKRLHFYPQLNLFLTIPRTDDKLIVRPVDVRKILNEKGIDYLYVNSVNPHAKVSQPYQYQLEAVSKAGGVKFSLQSGPEGLTVSSDGKVKWTTPAKPTEESVIVVLKDSSSQEAFHTFRIVVTE